VSAPARRGLEPWAWAAFVLAGLTLGLHLFLGLRLGGSAPVLAYRFGLLALGWASAVALLVALLWSAWRRPVLQRGRGWPLCALASSLWFCSLPLAYPSSHEGKFSPTRFRLPFEGAARVRYGGEERTLNPLLFDPARRFGTGFVPARGQPLRVVAPAAGTLVHGSRGRMGDVLVIATAAHEFCVLEGLDKDSCPLEPGSPVAAGDYLGMAPGLLFVHLQDRPVPRSGEGIPLRFWSYRADGRAAEAGVPVPPQEVASLFSVLGERGSR
jgi:hypothetical protein